MATAYFLGRAAGRQLAFDLDPDQPRFYADGRAKDYELYHSQSIAPAIPKKRAVRTQPAAHIRRSAVAPRRPRRSARRRPGTERARRFADAYPSGPIHVIVSFGPRGLADVTMRVVGEELKTILGQPIVIENHPGAGGIAAANAVLKAAPDGYTLIVLSNGTTIATSRFSHLSCNPETQFSPISTVAWFDLVLFINVNSPYKSVKELLNDVRKKPGRLNIGTVNPGSTQKPRRRAVPLGHRHQGCIVPFRIAESADRSDPRRHRAGDRLVHGVRRRHPQFADPADRVTGLERNPALPDIPSLKEQGVEYYDVTGWNVLYARPERHPPSSTNCMRP